MGKFVQDQQIHELLGAHGRGTNSERLTCRPVEIRDLAILVDDLNSTSAPIDCRV